MTMAGTAPLRVADLMTLDPISILVDASIEEAEALLRQHHITGLPVVDADERLVGVISQTDLLYLRMPSVRALIRRTDSGLRVGEVMSTPPITVDAAAPLIDAARRMERDHLHRLVVVDAHGRPIGVLAAMDFVSLAADG
jgi:CBS domain-containing protein